MQDVVNKILLEILYIIHFSDDKEKFVREFETYNHLDTLASLLDKLPAEVKKKIVLTEEHIEQNKRYISKESYIKEFEKTAWKELHTFIAHVSPVLTEAQRQEIDVLVTSKRNIRSHKHPLNFLTKIQQKIFR